MSRLFLLLLFLNIACNKVLVHPEKGDVVEVKEPSRSSVRIMSAIESAKKRSVPSWLEADYSSFKGLVKDLPSRDEVSLAVEENMVVEFYSR